MLKQIVILVVLTIVIILTQHYFLFAAQGLLQVYHFIFSHLGAIFSSDTMGHFFKQLIAFLAIPLFVGLILGGIYWLIRKSKLSNIMPIIWGVWLVLAVLIVVK